MDSKNEIIKHVGSGEVRVVSVKAYNENNNVTYVFEEKEKIVFEIRYHVITPVWNINMNLSIIRDDGVNCYGVNARADDLKPSIWLKDGSVRIVFCGNFLLPGRYSISLCIDGGSDQIVDLCNNLCQFEINGNKADSGVIRIPHEWVWKQE